jgi:ParB-like chromosome segregation protein Spo0J
VKIKLADIHIGKRFRLDKDVSDLIEDFKNPEVGQITPITVRPPTDEEVELGVTKPFVLVAGGRRTSAAMLVGWTEIEAFDKGQMSPMIYRIMELHENLKRKALHFTEEVALKDEIVTLRRLQDPTLTQAEIARELGETPANLSRDLATHRALVENPSLAGAGSKRAAAGAAQQLRDSELRMQRLQGQAAQPKFVASFDEKIVTAEAGDFLTKMPERSQDLGLFDGPYGYNYWKSGQKSEADDLHLSTYDDDPRRTGDMYRRVFPQIVRVMRETGWMVFFCGEETYDFLSDLARDCCATHASYRHVQHNKQCEAAAGNQSIGDCRFLVPEVPGWIWYRPNSRNNPRYRQLHAKNVYERVLVINMGKGQIVKWPCNNLLVHDAVYENRVHANEKPIPLYKDIIERLTFPGDAVFDVFHGSGNSLAAAAALSRDFRGCDKNPTMRQFAIARVQQHYQPMSPAAIKESYERYQRALKRTGEGVEDFTEDDETSPAPAPWAGREEEHEQMKKYLAERKALEAEGIVP